MSKQQSVWSFFIVLFMIQIQVQIRLASLEWKCRRETNKVQSLIMFVVKSTYCIAYIYKAMLFDGHLMAYSTLHKCNRGKQS